MSSSSRVTVPPGSTAPTRTPRRASRGRRRHRARGTRTRKPSRSRTPRRQAEQSVRRRPRASGCAGLDVVHRGQVGGQAQPERAGDRRAAVVVRASGSRTRPGSTSRRRVTRTVGSGPGSPRWRGTATKTCASPPTSWLARRASARGRRRSSTSGRAAAGRSGSTPCEPPAPDLPVGGRPHLGRGREREGRSCSQGCRPVPDVPLRWRSCRSWSLLPTSVTCVTV